MERIIVQLRDHERIRVRLRDRERITVRLKIGGVDIEWYDGDYVVTPSQRIQTLDCDRKRMRDDVTVLEIPYAEVMNPSGGKTATIG